MATSLDEPADHALPYSLLPLTLPPPAPSPMFAKIASSRHLCYPSAMQQPWPPQPREGFRDLLPVKSPKVSVLEAESSYYDRSPGFRQY